MTKQFTVRRVYFDKTGKKPYHFGSMRLYEFHKDDNVYYNINSDEDYFMEIPKNGKKVLSLRINSECRLLVHKS